MSTILKCISVVMTSLWAGVLFCLGFIVAPHLFALAARKSPAVPHTGVAADLIGPLLSIADFISMVMGIMLVATILYLRRRGEVPMGSRVYLAEAMVGLAAACAAINYWWITPQVRAVKGQLAERYGAFHLADKANPLYLQFNGLHQTSTVLFVIGLAAVLVSLICMTQFRSRQAESSSM